MTLFERLEAAIKKIEAGKLLTKKFADQKQLIEYRKQKIGAHHQELDNTQKLLEKAISLHDKYSFFSKYYTSKEKFNTALWLYKRIHEEEKLENLNEKFQSINSLIQNLDGRLSRL